MIYLNKGRRGRFGRGTGKKVVLETKTYKETKAGGDPQRAGSYTKEKEAEAPVRSAQGTQIA